VHSALVGEGAQPHVGLILIVGEIGDLGDIAGDFGELGEILSRLACVAHLEDEARDDGTEVGVAAALPDAVHGPLDVGDSGRDRKEGVRDGDIGVVVAVDAEPGLGPKPFPDGAYDLNEFSRQGPSVRVAEDDALGPCSPGASDGLDGVIRVCLVAVKEVFRVVEEGLDPCLEPGEGICDEFEVALEGDAKGVADMDVPCLSEDGDHGSAGRGQGLEVRIVFRLVLRLVRASKGADPGMSQGIVLDLLKELDVLGIGSGPSPLDVIHPEPVESHGDSELVLDRKGEILRLSAVPEGGVVDLNATDGHLGSRLVQPESLVKGPHGKFCIFLVDDAGDLDLGGADHEDVDAVAGEDVEHP